MIRAAERLVAAVKASSDRPAEAPAKRRRPSVERLVQEAVEKAQGERLAEAVLDRAPAAIPEHRKDHFAGRALVAAVRGDSGHCHAMLAASRRARREQLQTALYALAREHMKRERKRAKKQRLSESHKPAAGLVDLLESSHARLSADRSCYLLRNAEFVTSASRNGRFYEPEALEAAVPLYQGKPVYWGPASRHGKPRRKDEQVGVTGPCWYTSGRVIGSVKLFKDHPAVQKVLSLVEAGRLGLSHVVRAQARKLAGVPRVINYIDEVMSVDLVEHPGSTAPIGCRTR